MSIGVNGEEQYEWYQWGAGPHLHIYPFSSLFLFLDSWFLFLRFALTISCGLATIQIGESDGKTDTNQYAIDR
jgi:hypothetical protein